MTKKKIAFLTGAGISKESGIATFRDSKDGLWNNHKIEVVASPQGWLDHTQDVLDFYNARRREVKAALPNRAHDIVAEMEKDYDVTVCTQNIDDLHERAGSTKVYHVHGQIMRVKEDYGYGTESPSSIHWTEDLALGDLSDRGIQLRPDVVWFGEFINHYEECLNAVKEADYVIVIGTSLNVYPFSRLPLLKKPDAVGIYIDPDMAYDIDNYFLIEQTASVGLELIRDTIGDMDPLDSTANSSL